jgi:hypothetical protein
MFKDELTQKLKKIFAVKKVTFDQPGESDEQDCVFVDVEKSENRFKDKRALSKVSGRLTINANSAKMPFGYLSKKIAECKPEDRAGLSFFDLEENSKSIQNLVQRSCTFVYFFSSQYDPNIGNIDTVTIDIEET